MTGEEYSEYLVTAIARKIEIFSRSRQARKLAILEKVLAMLNQEEAGFRSISKQEEKG